MTSGTNEAEQTRITLGVLEAAQGGGFMSQRRLAVELGIALGLANAYVKRCVRKGLLKVSQAPAKRYVYYLTPEGMAEKSRLTADYLSYSFTFFRQARTDCAVELAHAREFGWRSIVLGGASEVAEIAAMCAIEAEIEVTCVVDSGCKLHRFIGLPVRSSYSEPSVQADGAMVTAISGLDNTLAEMTAAFGAHRVLMPQLLAVRLKPRVAAHD